jgi:hypothetical protein
MVVESVKNFSFLNFVIPAKAGHLVKRSAIYSFQYVLDAGSSPA